MELLIAPSNTTLKLLVILFVTIKFTKQDFFYKIFRKSTISPPWYERVRIRGWKGWFFGKFWMIPMQMLNKTYAQTAGIYLFKVSIGVICEIPSKFILKAQNNANDVALVSLLLTLNRFQMPFSSFQCWLWKSKYQLGI